MCPRIGDGILVTECTSVRTAIPYSVRNTRAISCTSYSDSGYDLLSRQRTLKWDLPPWRGIPSGFTEPGGPCAKLIGEEIREKFRVSFSGRFRAGHTSVSC